MSRCKAGREFDARLAQKVGWTWVRQEVHHWTRSDSGPDFLGNPPGDGRIRQPVPAFTTELVAAWDIVEYLRKDGYLFSLGDYTYGGKLQAMFELGSPFEEGSPHFCGADVDVDVRLAICCAAWTVFEQRDREGEDVG